MKKREIHVHIHKGAATQDAEPEGHWVTMHGAHIFIGKGGTIEKGPSGFVGKKPSDLASHLATKQDESKKTVAHHKGVSILGGPKGTVLVHAKRGATVRGATHYTEAGFHMSSELAAHHAAKGDLAHTPELKMAMNMTKADAKKQAREEYDKAKRGEGNFQKASELYEHAGEADKARDAKALAKMYGHDGEGQAAKGKADIAEAQKVREQMKTAKSDLHRETLEELAKAYESRSKDPDSNFVTGKISGLKDRLAWVEAHSPK